jgi:hypothetical protein
VAGEASSIVVEILADGVAVGVNVGTLVSVVTILRVVGVVVLDASVDGGGVKDAVLDGVVVDDHWFHGAGNGFPVGIAKLVVEKDGGTTDGVAVIDAREDSDTVVASDGRILLVG